MPNSELNYASFLLRLQRVPTRAQSTWVASLQSTTTNESRSFGSIAALVEFLRTEFDGANLSEAAGQTRSNGGSSEQALRSK